MRSKIALILILSIWLTLCAGSYSADNRIFNIEKAYQYSSADYNNCINNLVQKYPEILKSEKIGESICKKAITVIQLGINNSEDSYAGKLHILVEAGMHARENINPAIVLKMVEDYCRDYYNDNEIKEVSIRNELKDSVLHFIVLSSPDGHDYAKFGPSSVKNSDIIRGLDPNSYKMTKSNIRGVDIMDKAYGEAVAERIGGELVNYKGKPILHALTQTPGSPS